MDPSELKLFFYDRRILEQVYHRHSLVFIDQDIIQNKAGILEDAGMALLYNMHRSI
jgi:hypothetical protein